VGATFNPFTGQIDYTGSGSGGGSTVQTANYVHSFLTTDFTGPGGGNYTLSVAAATHGKGFNPILQIWEDIGGGSFEMVTVSYQIDSSGNLTLQVASSPDMRFSGKVIISENN
jgi:hypothetical protein